MYSWPEHVRYLNLHKPLPFESSSVDAIYASHVWEHLHLHDAVTALKECRRVLRNRGILRLAVPNLRYFCQEYLKSTDPDAAHKLHQNLLYRPDKRINSWQKRIYTALTDFHSHKFMYDPAYLSLLMTESGFVDVCERGFSDSGIPEIGSVESAGRVSPSAGFAVEGNVSKT